MAGQRIVLFPQGQPSDTVHKDACAEFYIRAGGDLARIIDGPFRSIEKFCELVRRIDGVVSGGQIPIIILSRTNPLMLSVVNVRRKIEAAIPSLRAATWAVFVDSQQDPFFHENARKLGALEPLPGGGLTWRGPSNEEYSVVLGPPASEGSSRSLSSSRMRAVGA